jgi:predicted Ser/Thr protein kinase
MIWTSGQLLQSGKYQVIQQIGGGGFGLTYLVQDQRLQRKVVIKAPNRIFQQEQDYEKFIRRFKREGQVLAKINHPNVVRVIEFFEEAGMPCLVMEYVEGETLNQCIRRIGYLPESYAVQYFRQLAMALQTVHQAGLIHCDVHPGNIMLQQGTEPVLIDFGSSKSLLPMTYTVTTTINESFTPYEQRKGDPQPAWDVYGLAATLYFAVTGQKPPAAMDRKFYGDNLNPPQAYRPELSDWLNQAILMGMTLEAEKRSPSIQAWLGLLHPPQPKPQSRPTPVTPLKKAPISTTFTSLSSEPFPWTSLGRITLGCVPTGIVAELSDLSIVTVTVSVFVAVAVLVAVAVDSSARAVARAWALALAGAGAWGLGALVSWCFLRNGWGGAVAVAAAGVGGLAGSVAAWRVVLTLAETWDWADEKIEDWGGIATIVGVLFGGAIAGHLTTIGIWAGLGFGLLPCIQLSMVLIGLSEAHDQLQQSYRASRIFLIYSTLSVSGLVAGGGIGFWLKMSGVHLPTV